MLLSFLSEERKPPTVETVLGVLFLAMSFFQRRYIPFWGIASAVLLYRLFLQSSGGVAKLPLIGTLSAMLGRAGRRFDQAEQRCSCWSWTLAAAVLLLCSTWWLGRLPGRAAAHSKMPARFPVEAASFLLQAEDRGSGHVFHHPDWGGYLIWRLYPGRRLFIDDRNRLNTETRYREFFEAQSAEGNWAAVLDRYRIEWVLLQREAPLASQLGSDPAWELLLDSQHRMGESAGSLLFQRKSQPSAAELD